MNKRIFIVVVAALLLAGCDGQPTGRVDKVDNVIRDISFQAEHVVEHCSKGCSRRTVPDAWFIQFCKAGNSADCFTRKIYHAPWVWQRVGQRVTVVWEQWSTPASSWWTVTSWRLSDTGEDVSL